MHGNAMVGVYKVWDNKMSLGGVQVPNMVPIVNMKYNFQAL